MKTNLTKHIEKEPEKTHAESVAEWIKKWENSRYLLRPLRNMLREQEQTTERIKESDFETPNHYALIAFRAGKRAAYQELLDMMPKSLDN